jgi:hypothetical protein
MKLGSIDVVVNDPDKALTSFLKVFGTNNVNQIIKFKGLTDTSDTVDGYYMKMKLVNLGLFTPRGSEGRMGKFLATRGEGIHNVEFHCRQDEFEHLHSKFKAYDWPVSEKPIWIGRFGEAIFWLEETGEQQVPIKFATKASWHYGVDGAVNLDTPTHWEKIDITETYLRPRVELNTIVTTTNDSSKQKQVWMDMLERNPREMGNQFRLERDVVVDGRGNIFHPVMFIFGRGGEDVTRVNMYHAVNPEGPINRFLTQSGKSLRYHCMTAFVTRDRTHEYWSQLEEAGFGMLDPKPVFLTSTGNYFWFVHPKTLHGVLLELVSIFKRENDKMRFDWSDSDGGFVSPDIPVP